TAEELDSRHPPLIQSNERDPVASQGRNELRVPAPVEQLVEAADREEEAEKDPIDEQHRRTDGRSRTKTSLQDMTRDKLLEHTLDQPNLAQRAESRPELLSEHGRLLPRREMPALGHTIIVDQL